MKNNSLKCKNNQFKFIKDKINPNECDHNWKCIGYFGLNYNTLLYKCDKCGKIHEH